MTLDPRTEANIATLTPVTQAKAQAFLQACLDSGRLPSGWKIEIISGLRSYDQQDALYKQGRTTPGKIVTNAPAGYSNHNFGTAFDIGIFDDKGSYIDDTLPETIVSLHYRLLGPIGRALGLTWGGDWASIDDEPHYELTIPGLTENQTLAKYRAMHEAGELIA